MLNLLLLGMGTCLILIRFLNYRSIVYMPEISIESLEYGLSGLKLFNNLTTFSFLSFLDHFFSHPTLSPIPSFFLVPFFSAAGSEFESLNPLFLITLLITLAFYCLWIWEMKTSGKFVSSKPIRGSAGFLCVGYGLLSFLKIPEVEKLPYFLLLMVSTLYLLRLLNSRYYAREESKQTKAYRSFCISLLLIFLSHIWFAALLFIVFLVFELQALQLSQREKFKNASISLIGWRRMPALSFLLYIGLLLFVGLILFPSLFPITIGQGAYLVFALLFLRAFILYRKSFLDLIHVSWAHRQVLYFLIFPAALWLLYPNPNRFEFIARAFSLQKAEATPVEKSSKENLKSATQKLLEVMANDRRLLVYGLSNTDIRCLWLDFELRRKYPDWSRNPEPEICPPEIRKVEVKELASFYRRRELGTLLIFHAQATGVPFEVPIFLRENKVHFERVFLHLKEWNLYASLFYLADNDQ